MNLREPHHPCICMIIPPHILEHLATVPEQVVGEEVRTAARLTIMQGEQVRTTRAAQVVDIGTLSKAAIGSPPRKTQRATRKSRGSKTRRKGALSEVMAPPTATAGREIFDCKNQWREPPAFELVRGENDPVSPDESVTSAYDVGGAVRDFYRTLGRNSIDNLGLNQTHNVHFGVGYMNAFWDGSEMTYGDGDGRIFVNFTKDPDIIAHELTHGVTQYTANLRYYSQSGALNESMSDVLASVIQQAITETDESDADWLIGDGIMGPSLFGEALRSMKAPGTAYDNALMGKDPQPDHMSRYYTGSADNQGVHINSGILNKVFYLVATDIGTNRAALVWYTTLQKLWSTAVFSDFALVLAESARLLTKSGQVRLGTTQQVRAALREVGL